MSHMTGLRVATLTAHMCDPSSSNQTFLVEITELLFSLVMLKLSGVQLNTEEDKARFEAGRVRYDERRQKQQTMKK